MPRHVYACTDLLHCCSIAREQDKVTKNEAGGSAGSLCKAALQITPEFFAVYKLHHNLTAGMMIPPDIWGNRAYLQEHDGAVPTESDRVWTSPGHTQLEDNPGLPSPYTGSPGELLKFDLDTLCMAKCYRKDQQGFPAQQRPCTFATF